MPEFERISRARGPVRMLIELEDFHGWDLPGLWEDLKFDAAHQTDMVASRSLARRPGRNGGTRHRSRS